MKLQFTHPTLPKIDFLIRVAMVKAFAFLLIVAVEMITQKAAAKQSGLFNFNSDTENKIQLIFNELPRLRIDAGEYLMSSIA